MADASPTLDGPEIPVHLGDAFVPFSFEWGMDATNALQELRRLLVDAADQLMAAAHINGTGAAQPTGLTVGLAAGSKVPTAAADTLAADDVYALQEALPPRFQTDAAWLSNLSVANTIAQFETGNGAKQFPELADGRLLRKPWNEANYLASPGDTASAGNDHILAYGDFGRGYVIVDRIGTTIEVVPHLFGANRRPTGQRGAIMWFRSGADVVVDNAIRILTA
jgi:HK97 family phage major capsid protein